MTRTGVFMLIIKCMYTTKGERKNRDGDFFASGLKALNIIVFDTFILKRLNLRLIEWLKGHLQSLSLLWVRPRSAKRFPPCPCRRCLDYSVHFTIHGFRSANLLTLVMFGLTVSFSYDANASSEMYSSFSLSLQIKVSSPFSPRIE